MHGLVSAALAAALATAPPAAPARTPVAVGQLTGSMVIPRFQAVATAAKAQQAAWAGFCAKRATADPAALHKAYEDVGDAWARIEFMRMGPAELELRTERFNYWLDRENATGRAMTAMLASTDPLTPEKLKAASVASQGRPVLERLLYGKDAPLLQAPGADGDRRCAIGQAVSTSMAALADEMVAGWAAPDGAAAAIAANHPWGVTFANADEASRVMLTDLVGGLDVLKDYKVAMAFHDEANPAAPLLAEELRAGRTMHDVMINFAALREALDVYMAPATPEQKKILADGLDDVAVKLKAVEEAQRATPLHSAERRAALQAAMASLTNLLPITMTTVPAGSGVSLGFNNLDGD